MAVRQDKIQFILEFLNEESQSLSRHVVDAKKLNDEIKKLGTEEAKLKKQFDEAAAAGKSTLDIEQKRTKVQAEINARLTDVLKTGKGIEDLDLSKVVPSQLVSTAKELAKAMEFIPQSHPTYLKLEAALKKVNDQMAINRTRTKGVAVAMQEAATEGSKMSHIFEIAFGVSLANMAEDLVQKIKNIGVELFKRSTDLEQFENKTKLVFGNSAQEIEAFAASMTEKVGLSTASIVADLNDISNSFTTLEFDKKDVTGLTKQLYSLSASWAAYNGGKYTALEVSEKFKVALGGEVDELAEMGIVLTQDTLKKEMQKKGYDKLTGAAFDQASALTLLDIITRKTAEAQENFGNHAESMAAKQARVTSFLKNAWDGVARSFVNLFSPILKIGSDIAEAFKDATPRMTQLANATKKENDELSFLVEKVAMYEKGTKGRETAINNLQRAYPDFLKNLNKETVTNEELRGKLQEVNKQYQAKRLLIETNKVVEEYMNKEKSATDDLADKQNKYAQQLVAARDIVKYYGDDVDVLKTKLREASDAYKGSYKDNNAQLYLQFINMATKEQIAAEDKLIVANQGKTKAQIQAKKVQEELLKQHPELAAAYKEIEAALNSETDAKNKNYAATVKFDKTYDSSVAKKQMEDAIKAVQAGVERKLVVLEKEKLAGKKSEIQYEEELFEIRNKGLNDELAVYKKYKQAQSLEAAKVEKELVEAEKHKATAIMKAKIDAAEAMATAMKTLEENKFLKNTEGSPKAEFDDKERAYKLRLLAIDKQFAEAKMKILRDSHQEESQEYLNQENKILKIKFDSRVIEKQQREADIERSLEAIRAEKVAVLTEKEAQFRDGLLSETAYNLEVAKVNLLYNEKELKEIENQGEKESATYRKLATEQLKLKKELNSAKIQEILGMVHGMSDEELSVLADKLSDGKIMQHEYNLAILDNDRQRYIDQIQLLRDAGKLTVELEKKFNDLITQNEGKAAKERLAIEKDLNKKKKEDKDKNINGIGSAIKSLLAVEIESMSRTTEEKKKNAEKIKRMQKAELVVSSIVEIANIWKGYSSMPIIGQVLAGVQTAIAAARLAIGLKNIDAQTFAKGGFTPSTLGGQADETGEEPVGVVHRNEWIAPRRMVEANPQLFKELDTMRLRGYATGGIAGLNILPNPSLVVPNYAYLSASGQLYGQTSGLQNTQNNSQSAFSATDERLLQAVLLMSEKMDSWQKTLKTEFSYTDFKKYEDRINTDIKAGSL